MILLQLLANLLELQICLIILRLFKVYGYI